MAPLALIPLGCVAAPPATPPVSTVAPSRVLILRDVHNDPLQTLDADGRNVPVERDRSCREADEVGVIYGAEFALVVLEPGGSLEIGAPWHTNRDRRVRGRDFGCETVRGSRLSKGKYNICWSVPPVWHLETAVEKAVDVQ